MANKSKVDIDIRATAALAKLALTDSEIQRFEAEIPSILDYADLLSELDLENVEPTAHATRIVNVYRDDSVGPTIPRAVVMKNAPATVDDELIKVPVVINPDEQGGA